MEYVILALIGMFGVVGALFLMALTTREVSGTKWMLLGLSLMILAFGPSTIGMGLMVTDDFGVVMFLIRTVLVFAGMTVTIKGFLKAD